MSYLADTASMRQLVAVLLISTSLSVLTTNVLHAQDLSITPNDLRIEQSIEGGYYLFIRQKEGVNSVLLTESTEDPRHQTSTYAWRSLYAHPENSGERRILDGQFLESKDLHFLVDSSPVDDRQLGKAFKIFIPWVIAYGYPWSRYGETQVMDGTFVSIRTFVKPYADYSGKYQDNPFIIRVSQKPMEGPPEGNYMPDTIKAFKEISLDTNGSSKYSKGLDDVVPVIEQILLKAPPPTLDIVLCIDATKSMENDLPYIRKNLIPMLEKVLKSFSSYRIGIVQYRDYLEDFLYQNSPFTNDLASVQKAIDRIRPAGGRDIPEAVNEALYGALKDFVWIAGTRLIILIGDAPPHPIPRGSVTPDMVRKMAKDKNVQIHTIILPQ